VLLYAFVRWSAQTPTTPTEASTPAIAVLPFVDMSPGHDHEYFGDGLSEEILNLLAESPALRVIARTSSFSFKDQTPDIATIADKLDATHVLEGSVRKSGERIRITAQLVDGATGVHLWSETYDRDLKDVFEVQTEIAATVAESLHVTLNIADRPTRGETSSTVAFEQYLQGRYFFNRRGTADVATARDHFEQAVQIDPNYARAWAGLAGAYVVADNADRKIPEDVVSKWRKAVERAVTLGPNLAEVQVRAAQYYMATGDSAAAKEHFRRAKALSPNDPLVLGVTASDGDLDHTITHWQRVVAVDPLSAVSRANLGTYLMAAGRWEEAKSAFRTVLEISPTWHEARASICRILVLEERINDALDTALQLPEGYPRDQCLALVHYAKGETPTADAALARLIAVGERPHTDVDAKLRVGEVYAYRGMSDEAFEWLSRVSQQTRDDRVVSPGWWIQQELPLSPFLQPLHEDPRWQSLLTSAE
jgi:TolB-like protein/tetratricopeptide (TPR) repeat protein